MAGVAGMANDIMVRLGGGDGLTDPETMRAAIQAIRAEVPTASENVEVIVHHGYITLEEKAECFYLKDAAERAVRTLRGVMGVTHSISIQPTLKLDEIKTHIGEAFRRSAQFDADRITIEAHGGEITLRGRVRSWSEHDEAQQTAWSAPGVIRVNNELTVDYV